MTSEQINRLIEIRKSLHRKPEISGSEEGTARELYQTLSEMDPDRIEKGVGGNGVMALFRSESETKKTLLFRAELDAIAVQEEGKRAHRSKNDGVMHGCGHDGHMAILLGLGSLLSRKRSDLANIWLLFQPAEETGEGALQVMGDSRFREIEPDHAFALHNLPGFSENTVLIRDGVFAAASVGLEVKFSGSSSHAAYPEQGVNPSKEIANLILEVEKRLSSFKKSDPISKVVNTYIRLGEPAYGISPGTARLGYTIRSSSDSELNRAVGAIEKLAAKAGETFEGALSWKRIEPFAATINESGSSNIIKIAAERAGLEVEEIQEPFPWSEDFGEFRKKCPITLFGLGSGADHPPLHSETYDFNDELIPAGVNLFAELAYKTGID
ncbi:MAG: amidohydrolase [Balneolaceae bacterium]|nr:amidohydrolase [Balneolaceae bacterium]MCH8549751.1 amidohydrolase [Balneolaceae bacterium]